MDIRHFRYLLAIADHQSIGRAAAALHKTQPALSKSLQHMEDWYGARLFERGTGGATPTSYGEIVLSRVRKMIAELDDSRREVGLLKGEEQRKVSVGGGPFYSEFLVAPSVGRLLAEFPNTSFDIHAGSREALLEKLYLGQIDLYASFIEESERRDSDLIVVELRFPVVVFYCRPAHPALAEAEASVGSVLARYPIASATPPQKSLRWLEKQVNSKRGRGDIPRVVCEQHPALKQVVANSDAIGIAPLPVVREEVDAGRLCLLPFETPTARAPCGIVYRKLRSLSPPTRALIDALQTTAEAW